MDIFGLGLVLLQTVNPTRFLQWHSEAGALELELVTKRSELDEEERILQADIDQLMEKEGNLEETDFEIEKAILESKTETFLNKKESFQKEYKAKYEQLHATLRDDLKGSGDPYDSLVRDMLDPIPGNRPKAEAAKATFVALSSSSQPPP